MIFELPSHPRIAIVGAGALGCYYGARLVQHGQEVHFLLRSDYEVVRKTGLSVHSHVGDFRLSPEQLHVYNDPAAMPQVDLVIVTLKSTANSQLEPLIRPLLKDSTAILTLQNGLGSEEELANLFGSDRILGGLAFVCINRLAPGQIDHTDYGLIKLGELGRPPSPRAHQIVQIFASSNVPCELLKNLALGRWEKLIWNVPFNGLGGAMDWATDMLMNSEHGTALVRALMEEVVATANAAGVNLPASLVEDNIRRTQSMGAYRSSMQVDRQMHRPMEIQTIIGNPLRMAQSLGVPTPKMEMLYQMLNVTEASS